jgi:hypothetical protein
MEASEARCAPITRDTEEITTSQITREKMEIPMRTDPSIKEGTRSIIPQMRLAAGTIAQSQWT